MNGRDGNCADSWQVKAPRWLGVRLGPTKTYIKFQLSFVSDAK